MLPFLSLPGVVMDDPLLAVGAFASGTVFRLFPLALLPGVLCIPEEEDDMLPDDEAGGGDCAKATDAIRSPATDVTAMKIDLLVDTAAPLKLKKRTETLAIAGDERRRHIA